MESTYSLHALAAASGMSIEEMERHPSLLINAFDRDHIVLFWNDRCADYFDISRDKALGCKLEALVPWTANDEHLQFLDRALMGIGMEVSRLPYRLKEGYYNQRVLPVRNAEGKVVAVLNIVEDLGR